MAGHRLLPETADEHASCTCGFVIYAGRSFQKHLEEVAQREHRAPSDRTSALPAEVEQAMQRLDEECKLSDEMGKACGVDKLIADIRTLLAHLHSQAHQLDILEEQFRLATANYVHLMRSKPAPTKEYKHLLVCNGDRRYPAGEAGHSCSCFNNVHVRESMTPQVEAAPPLLATLSGDPSSYERRELLPQPAPAPALSEQMRDATFAARCAGMVVGAELALRDASMVASAHNHEAAVAITEMEAEQVVEPQVQTEYAALRSAAAGERKP